MCLACANGLNIDPSTRFTSGSSKVIDARCGIPGKPTTLERALLQFTDIEGEPTRSESVAGALNSAISNFGSYTCATTRISPSLAVTGPCAADCPAVCSRSDTLAP